MIKRLLCAAILSLGATIYGLGLSYESFLTPKHALDRFSGIHPDSWIEDGASISLPDLAPFGNRFSISLKSWRPNTNAPAHFRVSVCGEQRGEFLVEKDGPFTLSANGSCEPRRIDIDVVNPVVVSEKDKRELGAQLQSLTVTSRFGVPLVSVRYAALVFLALMALWFIYEVALARLGFSWVALLLPVFATYFLGDLVNFNFARAGALWVLIASFGLGVLFSERYLRQSSGLDGREGDLSPRLSCALIAIIVLIGGVLRAYGLGFGLPSNYHPDEVPKVNAIMRMVDQGNLDPQYFLHPSLLLYSSFGLNKIFHFFGMSGTFRETAFFAGRCVSATAGTLSVYLLYRAAAYLFNRRVGLISSVLFAVFPLHVTCSRYMKEDALLLFFVLLALVITLKAVYEERPRLLILAGFVSGVSASSKYSGMLTILIVGAAPWLKSRTLLPDWRYFFHACIAGAVAPIGFILCTPYSVITPDKFLKDFNSERHHMERGHTIPFDAWSQYWTYHYWRSIVPGVGIVAAVLSVVAAGALICLWEIEGLFVIGLLAMFYLPAEWVKAKPAPQPERYILPCLPFIALACAVLLERLKKTSIKPLVPLLFVAAFLVPAIRTAELASEVPNDTRDQMSQWMIDNLPHGSTVLLDWKPYCPRFWHDEFKVVWVPRATILNNLSIENLKSSNGDYLVLSSLFYDRYFSQPNLDPALRERFREVFGRVPIIKEFVPKYGTYGFNNPSLTLFSLKKEDFARLESEIEEQRQGKREKISNEEFKAFPWRLKKTAG